MYGIKLVTCRYTYEQKPDNYPLIITGQFNHPLDMGRFAPKNEWIKLMAAS